MIAGSLNTADVDLKIDSFLTEHIILTLETGIIHIYILLTASSVIEINQMGRQAKIRRIM